MTWLLLALACLRPGPPPELPSAPVRVLRADGPPPVYVQSSPTPTRGCVQIVLPEGSLAEVAVADALSPTDLLATGVADTRGRFCSEPPAGRTIRVAALKQITPECTWAWLPLDVQVQPSSTGCMSGLMCQTVTLTSAPVDCAIVTDLLTGRRTAAELGLSFAGIYSEDIGGGGDTYALTADPTPVRRRPFEAIAVHDQATITPTTTMRDRLGPVTQPNQPNVSAAREWLDIDRRAWSGPMVILVPEGVGTVRVRCPTGMRDVRTAVNGQVHFPQVPSQYPCELSIDELGLTARGVRGIHGYACDADGCEEKW